VALRRALVGPRGPPPPRPPPGPHGRRRGPVAGARRRSVGGGGHLRLTATGPAAGHRFGTRMHPSSTAASPPTPSQTPNAGSGAPLPLKTTQSAAPCAAPPSTVTNPDMARKPSESPSARGTRIVENSTDNATVPATTIQSVSA